MPTPLRVLDSHVHLWPESMSNEESHAWMTPGMPLAKEHLLSAYRSASHTSSVEGIIYVETDVAYAPFEDGWLTDSVQNPLKELKFLKEIVEGKYGQQDSEMLLGIVAWAPMDQSAHVLTWFLRLAEETSGPELWKRVKGFRFLLQAISDQKAFESLVLSRAFVENLKILGKRGFSFDIGVDQNSGGIWQLEAISKAMERAHKDVVDEEKVVFVINHLCKPDFSQDAFPAWCAAIESMAERERTYMKLSGAFSELPEGLDGTSAIVTHLKPWTEHVLRVFGPRRVMFGSDWPVCNLKGPRQEKSWVSWKEVVEAVLEGSQCGLSEGDKERIWRGTAVEAYKIA